MASMYVRFVITGACHVSYSGKRIQLQIPVTQPDGSRTTVADVEAQVRREWPQELGEMAAAIKTVEMKILKTGRLLRNQDIFEEQLTKAELADCEVVSNENRTPEEIEKSSVLMHLVFQKEQKPVEPAVSASDSPRKELGPAAAPSPTSGGAANSNASHSNGHGSNNNSAGSREVKDDNCCCVM